MSIQVVAAGLFSSVQDRGRLRYARYGVPISGSMDQYSAGIANLLVHNPPNAAVLEITLQGPQLKFEEEAIIAVGGLRAKITVDKKEIDCNEPCVIKKGQTLQIHRVTEGVRAYLAVGKGILTDKVLGSRSQYGTITGSDKIKKGDVLPFQSSREKRVGGHAGIKFKTAAYRLPQLHVYPGPEWELLPQTIRKKLLRTTFHISKNNSRMAYQLEEKLENDLAGIQTQPVLPGTVQYTPAGNLIILMRDAQVTGGYPRILQLTRNSINTLAQKRMGDELRFKLVEY